MSETTAENEVIEGEIEDPMERAEARKAKSRRPRISLADSDVASSPVNDHKTSKAALDAQRREASDDEGKILCYYGGEGEEIELLVDPTQFDIEFQLMCENGTPARAILKLIGGEEMKKIMRFPAVELEKLMQSLAKQCGVGNS